MKRKIKTLPKHTFFLLFCGALLLTSTALYALATASPDIEHPIKKPAMYTSAMTCPNCGMMVNMWARTRHTFTNQEGEFETCSLRCLADLSYKAGESPQNAMVALYTDPEKMVPVEDATYVVGSSAAGTMTMKSKIAFGSHDSAQKFVAMYGGEIHTFKEVLPIATAEVNMTRMAIQSNRMKKGKITEPEQHVSCTLCGMFPAKFPEHRSQIKTKEGQNLHFCSSKCLVNYLADPEIKKKTAAAWVTVIPDGDYELADSLYYIVGSSAMGPMGPEALPYRVKSEAQAFAEKNGGKVVRWTELSPSIIMGK